MNLLFRISLFVVAFVLAVFAVGFIVAMLSQTLIGEMFNWLSDLRTQRTPQIILIVFWGLILLLALSVMAYIVLNGRLRNTRVRSGEAGTIDIGVDAIESIALNSAKSAQAGIKAAKARVSPASGNKIKVALNAVLYSDVEVPAMMTKVQERIKKDIERYTGIPVARVIVRVSRVEAVAARVER